MTVIFKRARQLSTADGSTTDTCRRVSLNFYVHAKLLESAIDLKFIDDVESYDVLDDYTL